MAPRHAARELTEVAIRSELLAVRHWAVDGTSSGGREEGRT
jgi:hypothetical protein